ncbi:MAG: hypothetical protein M1827_003836 [Pycnora praestabilis]|nr:MAG: hypothetical protein M1827_003836 [Pycnora praestabilis]
MSKAEDSPAVEYWGYLFKPDKSATDLLDNLLRGIANSISKTVEPKDDQHLTPTKLAAFYRLVGGNYDTLFVDTPHPSISFIYQSLGCLHSLQPSANEYAPPSIPALTPKGFVRWQTVQLLLGPEEHVPFLQEALRKYDIVNPAGGGIFPKILPMEAFPNKPDVEMTQWHDGVCERLRTEAQNEQEERAPAQPGSSEAPHMSRESSGGGGSVSDAAGFFSSPRYRAREEPENIIHVSPPSSSHHRRPHLAHRDTRHSYSNSPENRRRSFPEDANIQPVHSSQKPRPTSHRNQNRHRPRSPSEASLSSSSSESGDESDTPSESEVSPVLRHHRSDEFSPTTPPFDYPPRTGSLTRAHPAYQANYNPRNYGPISGQPQHIASVQHVPASSYFAHRSSLPGPPRGNYRGSNVRWSEVNELFHLPGSAASTPGALPSGPLSREVRIPDRFVERDLGRGADRPRIRRLVSPLRGVDGRRYPTDGIVWH